MSEQEVREWTAPPEPPSEHHFQTLARSLSSAKVFAHFETEKQGAAVIEGLREREKRHQKDQGGLTPLASSPAQSTSSTLSGGGFGRHLTISVTASPSSSHSSGSALSPISRGVPSASRLSAVSGLGSPMSPSLLSPKIGVSPTLKRSPSKKLPPLAASIKKANFGEKLNLLSGSNKGVRPSTNLIGDPDGPAFSVGDSEESTQSQIIEESRMHFDDVVLARERAEKFVVGLHALRDIDNGKGGKQKKTTVSFDMAGTPSQFDSTLYENYGMRGYATELVKGNVNRSTNDVFEGGEPADDEEDEDLEEDEESESDSGSQSMAESKRWQRRDLSRGRGSQGYADNENNREDNSGDDDNDEDDNDNDTDDESEDEEEGEDGQSRDPLAGASSFKILRAKKKARSKKTHRKAHKRRDVDLVESYKSARALRQRVIAGEANEEDFVSPLTSSLVFSVLRKLDKHQIGILHSTFARHHNCLGEGEFVQAVQSCLAHSHSLPIGTANSPKTAAELKEAFTRIDVCGSGVITWQVFADFVLFGSAAVAAADSLAHLTCHTYREPPEKVTLDFDEKITNAWYFPSARKIVTSHSLSHGSVWSPSGTLMARLKGHTAPITACTSLWTNDGEARIVTSALDRTLLFWDANNHTLLHRLRTSKPQISLAYWAPYGSSFGLLFSGGMDGTVDMHRVASGVAPESLPTPLACLHKDWVVGLAVLPEFDAVVSVSLDSTVFLYDTRKQALLRQLFGHHAAVNAVDYSSQHRLLFTGGQEREILVWNPYFERPLHSVTGHVRPISHVISIPNTDEIVTLDTGGTAKVWDLRNLGCIQSFNVGHPQDNPVAAMVYNPNKMELVTATPNHWAIYPAVSVATQNYSVPFAVTHILYNEAFSCVAVVGGSDVSMWNMAGGLLGFFKGISPASICAVCFDSLGRLLFLGDTEGSVKVCSATTGEVVIEASLYYARSGDGHESLESRRPAVGRGGLSVVAEASGGPRKAATVEDLLTLHSPSTDVLAVFTSSGHAVVIDVSATGDRRVLQRLTTRTNVTPFTALAVSHRRRWALAACGRRLRLWKMDTYATMRVKEWDEDVVALAIADNVNAVLIGDSSCTLHIASASTLSPLAFLSLDFISPSIASFNYCSEARVLLVTFSPDDALGMVAATLSIGAILNLYKKALPPAPLGRFSSVTKSLKRMGVTKIEQSFYEPFEGAPTIDLSPHTSDIHTYTWTDIERDTSCTGMTQGTPGVMIGTVAGLVSIYSIRGKLQGHFNQNPLESHWSFVHERLDERDDADGLMQMSQLEKASRRAKMLQVEFADNKERYASAVAPFYTELARLKDRELEIANLLGESMGKAGTAAHPIALSSKKRRARRTGGQKTPSELREEAEFLAEKNAAAQQLRDLNFSAKIQRSRGEYNPVAAAAVKPKRVDASIRVMSSVELANADYVNRTGLSGSRGMTVHESLRTETIRPKDLYSLRAAMNPSRDVTIASRRAASSLL